MNDKKPGEIQLEIHLDEETAQGVYANLAVVNQTDSEFTPSISSLSSHRH